VQFLLQLGCNCFQNGTGQRHIEAGQPDTGHAVSGREVRSGHDGGRGVSATCHIDAPKGLQLLMQKTTGMPFNG
jgi:hypothetical protein